MAQDQKANTLFTSDAPSWVYWALTAAMMTVLGVVWYTSDGLLHDLENAAEVRANMERGTPAPADQPPAP